MKKKDKKDNKEEKKGGPPTPLSPQTPQTPQTPQQQQQQQQQQPQALPEERYRVQLQQLSDMGFTDTQANIRALTQTGGNVQLAIERLLSGV